MRVLSKERRDSLYQILPLAVITGIADVLVVGLVSRVFIIIVGKENRPSIPFSDLFSSDPFIKFITLICIYIIFNWIASFLRLTLRAFQERVRALIFIDLSLIAQKNIFNHRIIDENADLYIFEEETNNITIDKEFSLYDINYGLGLKFIK